MTPQPEMSFVIPVYNGATALSSLFLFVAIVIDKLYINLDVAVGVPAMLVTVVFFAGAQLVVLGSIGAYRGRVRYVRSRVNSRKI